MLRIDQDTSGESRESRELEREDDRRLDQCYSSADNERYLNSEFFEGFQFNKIFSIIATRFSLWNLPTDHMCPGGDGGGEG